MSSTLAKGFVTWLPALGYLVCLETLAPFLAARRLAPIWWLCLVALLCSMYALWTHPKLMTANVVASQRVLVKKTDYVLLGLMIFLYDPTIRPHLAKIGLSWLWLVALVTFFAWVTLDVIRTIKRASR